MSLQLELVKKENTVNKRKVTILNKQVVPTSDTTIPTKPHRGKVSISATNKKAKSKQSVSKKKTANKKRVTRKSVSRKNSSRPIAKKVKRRSKPDDLKKIHGIGPVLEKLLHKNGITRFEQLAKLDRKGVDALSAKLGSFSNRIRSDGWVKSAAKLAAKRAA